MNLISCKINTTFGKILPSRQESHQENAMPKSSSTAPPTATCLHATAQCRR
ncbi:MAG: hypothetical protein Q3971_07945 [Moraxella sp.]|nr:hypothetical protein [Moraxella sp.]